MNVYTTNTRPLSVRSKSLIIRVMLYSLCTDPHRKRRFLHCWGPFTERSHIKGRGADLQKTSHVIRSKRLRWWAGCYLTTSSKYSFTETILYMFGFRGFRGSAILAWGKRDLFHYNGVGYCGNCCTARIWNEVEGLSAWIGTGLKAEGTSVLL
jgi:hypothetical protein